MLSRKDEKKQSESIYGIMLHTEVVHAINVGLTIKIVLTSHLNRSHKQVIELFSKPAYPLLTTLMTVH